MTYSSTDAEARDLGFTLPTGTDLIRDGDNAISGNARVATGAIRAAYNRLRALEDTEDFIGRQLIEQNAATLAAAQAAQTSADAAARLAGEAQAAKLEVPDDNVAALVRNDETETAQAGDARWKTTVNGQSGDVTLTAADVGALPATYAPSVAWGSITGKPSTFTPAPHTQAVSTITGLQSALDGKAATLHTHDATAILGLFSTVVEVTVSSSITGTATVTFPPGRFSAAPVVSATPIGQTYQATTGTPSTSSVVVTVRSINDTSGSATVRVQIIAVNAP